MCIFVSRQALTWAKAFHILLSHLFIIDMQRLSQTAAMVIQVTEANLGTVKYHCITAAKLFALHLIWLSQFEDAGEWSHTGSKPGRGPNPWDKVTAAGIWSYSWGSGVCEPCTTSVASLFQGPSDALSHGSITLQVKLILSCPCCWAEVLMKGNYDDDPVQTVYWLLL